MDPLSALTGSEGHGACFDERAMPKGSLYILKEETPMKKSKVLLTLACAVLLVAASVMGTLAYLTSQDEVVNSFMVGEAVAITLDEAKTNELGVADTSVERVKTNTYKLMPGHNYTKDPTVHVTGEECYVFVTVTNGISGIEAEGNTTIAAQMAANSWKAVDESKGLYIYATGEDAKTVVSKTTDLPVFSSFTVKDDADHATLEAVEKATITINAYAVQKDGFEGKTPAEIWAETFGK